MTSSSSVKPAGLTLDFSKMPPLAEEHQTTDRTPYHSPSSPQKTPRTPRESVVSPRTMEWLDQADGLVKKSLSSHELQRHLASSPRALPPRARSTSQVVNAKAIEALSK